MVIALRREPAPYEARTTGTSLSCVVQAGDFFSKRIFQSRLNPCAAGTAANLPNRTFMRREDLESDKWAPEIVGAEAVPALNMLYVLVSAAGPPNDLPPMVDAVAQLVGRCDSEHRNQAVQLSFVAAAKWKSADLADRLMQTVSAEPDARDEHIGATAEFAVSAAAAQPDAPAMRDAAVARLTDLAFGPLEHEAAATLADFLDLLANVVPPWPLPSSLSASRRCWRRDDILGSGHRVK